MWNLQRAKLFWSSDFFWLVKFFKWLMRFFIMFSLNIRTASFIYLVQKGNIFPIKIKKRKEKKYLVEYIFDCICSENHWVHVDLIQVDLSGNVITLYCFICVIHFFSTYTTREKCYKSSVFLHIQDFHFGECLSKKRKYKAQQQI